MALAHQYWTVGILFCWGIVQIKLWHQVSFESSLESCFLFWNFLFRLDYEYFSFVYFRVLFILHKKIVCGVVVLGLVQAFITCLQNSKPNYRHHNPPSRWDCSKSLKWNPYPRLHKIHKWLSDCLVTCIENDVFEIIDNEAILEHFQTMGSSLLGR